MGAARVWASHGGGDVGAYPGAACPRANPLGLCPRIRQAGGTRPSRASTTTHRLAWQRATERPRACHVPLPPGARTTWLLNFQKRETKTSHGHNLSESGRKMGQAAGFSEAQYEV